MEPGRTLRRRVIVIWLGAAAGVGLALAAASALAPQRVTLPGAAAAVVAVGAGTVATRRAIRAERRILITVRDLRDGLRQRPR